MNRLRVKSTVSTSLSDKENTSVSELLRSCRQECACQIKNYTDEGAQDSPITLLRESGDQTTVDKPIAVLSNSWDNCLQSPLSSRKSLDRIDRASVDLSSPKSCVFHFQQRCVLSHCPGQSGAEADFSNHCAGLVPDLTSLSTSATAYGTTAVCTHCVHSANRSITDSPDSLPHWTSFESSQVYLSPRDDLSFTADCKNCCNPQDPSLHPLYISPEYNLLSASSPYASKKSGVTVDVNGELSTVSSCPRSSPVELLSKYVSMSNPPNSVTSSTNIGVPLESRLQGGKWRVPYSLPAPPVMPPPPPPTVPSNRKTGANAILPFQTVNKTCGLASQSLSEVPFGTGTAGESPLPAIPLTTAGEVYVPTVEQDEEPLLNRRAKPPASLPSIKVRAIISGWRAGTLIGRQGLVISNLRHESRCKITISDDPTSPDRVLTIFGPPTQVAMVLRKVCALLAGASSVVSDAGVPRRSSSGRTSSILIEDKVEARTTQEFPSDNFHTVDAACTATLEMNAPMNFSLAVPSPLCGCLIGRGGSQIRDFRQKYGVSFAVSSTSIPESQDRLVNVSGPASKVADCLQDVCQLFALTTPSLSRRRTGASDRFSQDTELFVTHSGSTGSSASWRRRGAGGADRQRGSTASPRATIIAPEGNRKVTVQNDKRHNVLPQRSKSKLGPSLRRSVSVLGNERSAKEETSLLRVDDELSSEAEPHLYPRRFEAPAGGSECGQGEVLMNIIHECSFTLTNGQIEVYLLVPNDIVGCIIGKRGKTISEIRDTSGTFISITESTFPPTPPRNAASTDTYPSPAALQHIVANGARTGARRRDRVICIRGSSKDVNTARCLMGNSILTAQPGSSKNVCSQPLAVQ